MANTLRLVPDRVPLESIVVWVIAQIAFRLAKLRRSRCSKTLRVRCSYYMWLSVFHNFTVQPVYLQESRPLVVWEFFKRRSVWNAVSYLILVFDRIHKLNGFVNVKRLWCSALPPLLKVVKIGFSSLLIWGLRACECGLACVYSWLWTKNPREFTCIHSINDVALLRSELPIFRLWITTL